jgi:hypothetical protein
MVPIRRIACAAAFVSLATCLAACSPMASPHRYASSNQVRHGCERVAPTGSRIRNATRCNWQRHPDSSRIREQLSRDEILTHPRERAGRPTGY